MTTLTIEDGHLRVSEYDDDELVGWDDPRWLEHGVTYRRCNWWTQLGHLNVVGDVCPGSGYVRRWPVEEITVAGRMVRLIAAGLSLAVAARVARLENPVELGPGIILTVDGVPS